MHKYIALQSMSDEDVAAMERFFIEFSFVHSNWSNVVHYLLQSGVVSDVQAIGRMPRSIWHFERISLLMRNAVRLIGEDWLTYEDPYEVAYEATETIGRGTYRARGRASEYAGERD